jgi:hypothetical protein
MKSSFLRFSKLLREECRWKPLFAEICQLRSCWTLMIPLKQLKMSIDSLEITVVASLKSGVSY